MDQHRLATATRSLTTAPSRRDLLRGLTSAGLGLGMARTPVRAEGRKKAKPTPKPRQGLCTRDGSKCRRPGKTCKKRYCLSTPFTIEASWTKEADHETYLFVPPQNAATGFAPYIYAICNPDTSRCAEAYPFACVDDDAIIGAEVTTIHRLLPGTYEYWIELDSEPDNPDGEVAVTLKAKDGRVVRRWRRRPNPVVMSGQGWHVFDIDGRTGRVTTIDEAPTEPPIDLPNDAYDPSTNVCPFNT
jgi:hypothetical protein